MTFIDLKYFIFSVENKCYVLDLAQSTKSWEDFPALPEGFAYNALVYNEKVNRLYSIGGERGRYDYSTGVGSTWVSNQKVWKTWIWSKRIALQVDYFFIFIIYFVFIKN